jgi:tRNA nucleotidyltransferase (CCA-adding enzyme)
MSAVVGDLRERVRALPGMDRLLPALARLPPAYLVGGAVRDLLRGARAVDLDVAIEGDVGATARELAARLGGYVVQHERFGTATVTADALAVDVSATRRESYPEPGALPVVEPARLEDDLWRRDFTINAMAVSLSGDQLGRLHDPTGGAGDLRHGTVRVLHERSFVDDPTRLLRAIRYEIRLGFAMDPDTERLAQEAASDGALATVSGPRIRDALLGLLSEHEAPSGVARMHELGIDRALHPALDPDPELVASAALGAPETGADRALAVLAALIASSGADMRDWLDELHLTRDWRERVARAARHAPSLASMLHNELPPSSVHALLHCEAPETLALALAMGAPSGPILRYVHHLRGVRLEITGADLLAAGLEPSPAIGRALDETLRRKLDGEVHGRDEELQLALEVARGYEAEDGA